MIIKLFQRLNLRFRIDAIFPPQKRTILLRELDINNIISENAVFLNFPKLVFTMTISDAYKNIEFEAPICSFELMAINDKNELINIWLPNLINGHICMGDNLPFLYKQEIQNFTKKPTEQRAKTLIKPRIDAFWNSYFTINAVRDFRLVDQTIDGTKLLIQNFNNSLNKILTCSGESIKYENNNYWKEINEY